MATNSQSGGLAFMPGGVSLREVPGVVDSSYLQNQSPISNFVGLEIMCGEFTCGPRARSHQYNTCGRSHAVVAWSLNGVSTSY